MKIKQFIQEALLNIVEGVNEANSKHPGRFKIIGVQRHNKERTDGAFVEFDISVVVENTSSGKAGTKIGSSILNVVSGNVSSEIRQNNTSQDTHRLKFNIYISENLDK